MSCPTNEHYKYLAKKIKLVARYKIVQRQKICLICRLTHFMMPGSKVLNPHELAHRWMKDLGTRPDMEQNEYSVDVRFAPTEAGECFSAFKVYFLKLLDIMPSILSHSHLEERKLRKAEYGAGVESGISEVKIVAFQAGVKN